MQNSPDSQETAFVIGLLLLSGHRKERRLRFFIYTASYFLFIFLRTMTIDKTEPCHATLEVLNFSV